MPFAGIKITGSPHGQNTSMTFPKTFGLSWPPGWRLSLSSRYVCVGDVCLQKVEGQHLGSADTGGELTVAGDVTQDSEEDADPPEPE